MNTVLRRLAAAVVTIACTALLLNPCPRVRSSTRNRSASADPQQANAAPSCEDRNASACLQQALWGKCGESYMRPGNCDVACGRCASERRSALLRRTLLVSARQSAPCAETAASGGAADSWVLRALQNHGEYARAHGMTYTWTSALVDSEYDGAWNKLAVLHRLLRRELLRPQEPSGSRAIEWLLWCDWDLVFVDLGRELPLEEYERRGARLVPRLAHGPRIPEVGASAARSSHLVSGGTGGLGLLTARWLAQHRAHTLAVASRRGALARDAVGEIACFRIPSVVQTARGTLLAFAEARGRFAPGWNATRGGGCGRTRSSSHACGHAKDSRQAGHATWPA